MSDFDPLRRALTDLSERAADADLYDRSLRTSRRLARRRRTFTGAAAVLLAIPILLFGGNGSSQTPTYPGAGPSSAATPPTASPNATRLPGCPVDSTKLYTALQTNTAITQNLPSSLSGLQGVSCYQDYATALTKAPGADTASVLFHYDRTTSVWSAIDFGSSMTCDAVPAEIRSQLQHCFSG